MSTIDILLSLGGKIADVLMLFIKKGAGKQEKETAETLIKQYNQLKENQEQIEDTVKNYNQGIIQAITSRSVEPLFHLCTPQGYEHVKQLYSQYLGQGIRSLVLEDFEILSVNLLTHKVETQKAGSLSEISDHHAHVYSRGKWISIYSKGPRDTSDVINRYLLILENGNWKIDSAEVYTRSD